MSLDHCAGGLHSGYCLGKVSLSQKVWKVTLYTASVSALQRRGEEEDLVVGDVLAGASSRRKAKTRNGNKFGFIVLGYV